MKTLLRSLDSIKPYPQNPRVKKGAVEQVAALIEEYGFTNPILLDREGVIIAGHTRYEAARQVGLKRVPTITLDHLSEQQARALRVADNRSSEMSEWDWPTLAGELELLSDDGFDLALTAFPEDSIQQILEGLARSDPQFASGQVTPNGIAQAEAKLDKIDAHQGELRELECPACGHEFLVE